MAGRSLGATSWQLRPPQSIGSLGCPPCPESENVQIILNVFENKHRSIFSSILPLHPRPGSALRRALILDYVFVNEKLRFWIEIKIY